MIKLSFYEYWKFLLFYVKKMSYLPSYALFFIYPEREGPLTWQGDESECKPQCVVS